MAGPDPAVVSRLRDAGVATIHEAQGRKGPLPPQITPIQTGVQVAGPAVTVVTNPDDNMMIRLNRNRHPEIVEIDVVHPVLGPARLTTEYSGYRDYEPIDPLLSDEIMSGFRFPSRIVQKLDGNTILDIEIETCWCTNAYVIFPVPENVASASASR